MDTAVANQIRTDAFRSLERARIAAKPWLSKVMALQILRTCLRLGFSVLAACCAGLLVTEGEVGLGLLAGTLLCLLAAALVSSIADEWQVRAEADVAAVIRTDVLARIDELSSRQVGAVAAGAWVVGLQRYPDALASLVIGHRAASQMMAVAPFIAAAVLAVVSWQAALLVLCLTPVMIIFFALVGEAIRNRAEAQTQAFQRLAGQFADRIRALPTILANHALPEEAAKLESRLQIHMRKTMGVLSIAFINAGIIDFFSSLSIAILAVFLGLGHLHLIALPGFSDLQLWQSLLILMVAPEYFAPFRRFSEQYHAKAEGAAAAVALDDLLQVSHEQTVLPAILLGLCPDLPARGLVALTGKSGSGKSTLLRQIAGVEWSDAEAGAGQAALPADIAWVSGDAFLPAGTVGAILRNDRQDVSASGVEEVALALGLQVSDFLPKGLDETLPLGATTLSGGQRLRLILARALLSGRPILADEPTAKLDPVTARLVRSSLLSAAQDRLVVVATHDPVLAGAAIRVVDLDDLAREDAA